MWRFQRAMLAAIGASSVAPTIHAAAAAVEAPRPDFPLGAAVGRFCGMHGVMGAFAAICSLLAVTDVAVGADMAPGPYFPPPPAYAPLPPPPYNWSGWYVGANVGYGFPTGNTTAAIIGGPLSGVSGIGFTNLSGVVAGGQLGGNYQIDRFVFGVEGDFDWSGQSKSGAAGILSETVRLPWMATIRGRGGIAFDRVLVYGTAGIAFINASDSLVESGAGTIYNPSSTSTGLAAGAGVEFAFAQNWTARMEYLYIGTNLTLSGPLALIGGTVTENGKLNDSLVRAGISFKYP